MLRRAHSPALQVEQLEDRFNPAGSIIPAGEFNWTQYSPTGELGQLLWNGGTLVYQSRVAGAWSTETVASSGIFTAGEYNSTDAVQKASQTAQLVFTSDGTPHALFLEKVWAGSSYQTLIQHYARTSAGWQHVETITPTWQSAWGPNNLVAEAGANNSIHLIFTETTAAATGVGNFGSGQLWYSTNASGSWGFAKIADTADLAQDVWFTGGRWAPRFLSLAVDSLNYAHVTYTPQFYIAGAFSTVNSTLMYATNRGGVWNSQTLMAPGDGTADAGLGASVAVGPGDQIAVASYYVDRYNTGSPQTSQLMYHTLTAGGWTHTVVANAPAGYVAGDGAKFTGFAPQLYFDASGQANIVFSDEAAEHLPVSYANQFAGQIRLATLAGGAWSIQTIYAQTDPIHNQLLYPVAATYNGQTTFAGLVATSTVDGNKNPIRTDYTPVDVNAPYGSATPPVSTTPPIATKPGSTTPAAGAAAGGSVSGSGWAVASDSGATTSRVYVYRADGTLSMSVTPFGEGYRGGVRIARGDVNGDGVIDLITVSGAGIESRVRVWSGVNAAMIADFVPFVGYQGGLWVAAGDINGDGAADIALGTDLGNVPHVKVFSGRGVNEIASFYAYSVGFLGGVRVGVGDLNRDGFADLVTGAGYGAGPHVRMFDGKAIASGAGPKLLANDFFAFAPSMTAGLNITVGDIDGDGYADIAASPGAGAAHLRVFSGRALANGQGPVELLSTIAWDGATGLRTAAADVNGDGRMDLIATTAGANNGRIAVFTNSNLLPPNPLGVRWIDTVPGTSTGVFVG
ncbi:VCBS repeat-containing protein [Gemmata sp. JC673]|uniref:VCBS repeat-containing protein n=1 Tax=Gemmata algarum TaxID=2975278 RepID=A0ABU5F0E7_9BACT|nr:VCBS repeat-containing protein [Gemmata algarum]MDY3561036.1 VCBS repeat-containing protein [Gemmata algarum]